MLWLSNVTTVIYHTGDDHTGDCVDNLTEDVGHCLDDERGGIEEWSRSVHRPNW